MSGLLLVLLGGLAQAADVGASVSLGGQRFLGEMAGVVDKGQRLEAALTISLGSIEVGGAFVGAAHDACHYALQAMGACPNGGVGGPLVPGDLRVTGFGPVLSAPELVDLGGLTLGASTSVTVGSAPLLMDEQYFNEEVVSDAWGGSNPGIVGGGLVIRAAARAELGVPLSETTALFVAGEGAFHVGGLGLAWSPVLGVRVSP